MPNGASLPPNVQELARSLLFLRENECAFVSVNVCGGACVICECARVCGYECVCALCCRQCVPIDCSCSWKNPHIPCSLQKREFCCRNEINVRLNKGRKDSTVQRISSTGLKAALTLTSSGVSSMITPVFRPWICLVFFSKEMRFSSIQPHPPTHK